MFSFKKFTKNINMYTNLFLNAEIKKAAYVWFYPILSQSPKDFWAGTSVEGWTLHWKLDLFVWFLWWLCKKIGFEELATIFARLSFTRLLLKMPWNWINYTRQQPVQADFFSSVFGTFFFAKAHKKSQDNKGSLQEKKGAYLWKSSIRGLTPPLIFGSYGTGGTHLTACVPNV